MTHTTRFAPSPTGYLHLGHAFSALFARARGERFLLRIEDIDHTRCRPEYTAAITEDLAWLGITWDGPIRIQSRHAAEHRAALARLRPLLYPCFCSRADIAAAAGAPHVSPSGPDGPIYPGTCRTLAPAERERRIAAGHPHAWRLDTARASPGPLFFTDRSRGRLRCEPEAFGDVVLGRRDAGLSYHLCVVCDDSAQNITLVTRGEDLLRATAIHRLLQTLLDLPEPLYDHHPLLLDKDGKRLAKRDGAPTLRSLRAAGETAAAVVAGLGRCW